MRNKEIKFKSINIFFPFYTPHVGGVENYIRSLSDSLVKRDYLVNIISCKYEKTLEYFEKINGVNVYRFDCINLLSGRYPIPINIIQLISLFRKIYSINNKNSINLIETRFFSTSILGCLFGLFSKTRTVVFEHGSSHLIMGDNKIINFIIEVYEHFITLILKLFDNDYVCMSKASSKWISHFGIKTNNILNYGVSYHLVSKKSNTIFYAGRLIKEKGVLNLIHGFELFCKKNTNYKLVIAGFGDLTSEIKELIKDKKNITYLGVLSQKEVMLRMSKFKILVYPSNYPECMPTSILQAGMCGMVVVATKMGGVTEVIRHKSNGYLLKNNSSKEICNALINLVKNPKYMKLGKSLRKYIISDYEEERVIDQHINFLKNLK